LIKGKIDNYKEESKDFLKVFEDPINKIGDNLYFDREGKEISLDEFANLSEDRSYKIVKQEQIGEYFVSTVWLGIDHGFAGCLKIFETMIFHDELDCDYMERYATESEAFFGHKEAVKYVRKELIKETNEKGR
jgi:hypothetical protein